ncbi:MAG: nitroreductase family protein, partial [Tannerella sp.]|nr:nitroreductase family protein [Tannerella sp.]
MDFTSLITNRRSTRKFTNQLLSPEQVEPILKTAQKKKHQPVKAVFIGSGNVATHLSHAMQKEGITIIQIFSRSEANARLLAETLHTQWTTKLNEVATDADLYVFSLKDSVLQDIIARMLPNNGLWIHTAGSLPLDIFKGYTERYGVFYPLQTFSRTKAISFRNIPCFIEAYREEDEGILCDIAGRLSDNV